MLLYRKDFGVNGANNIRNEAEHYGAVCGLDINMCQEKGYEDLFSYFGQSIYDLIDEWLVSKRTVLRQDLYETFGEVKNSYGVQCDVFVGSEYMFRMKNGYGARVEKSEKSIGGTLNQWQITPLIWIAEYDEDGDIMGYEHSITPDTQLVNHNLAKKGGLNIKEVVSYLLEISQLDGDLKGIDEDE